MKARLLAINFLLSLKAVVMLFHKAYLKLDAYFKKFLVDFKFRKMVNVVNGN